MTSLIQPMNQGVLQVLTMKYRGQSIRRLIIEHDIGGSIVQFVKGVNMKVVVELVAESWNEIQSTTICKSWQKIIPITTTPSDTPPIRMARVNNFPEILTDALHERYV